MIGPTNSRTVDNVVSNTGTGSLNNIVAFTSDKVIKDSGIPSSSISGGPFLPLAGGTMTSGATVNSNNGAITNLSTINGKTTNDLVTGPGSATTGQLAIYSGTSGKVITNSSIGASILVRNTAGTSTPGNLCSMLD